ncbi:proteolipid protein DM beta-like isoform X1 [Limulus polyphemus]|uniref:Proteolipid protein DM beta-like isoform X1 n=1 Tax=Limulus polyphemus TaxID=6850 RepID=A0ABM1RWD3_LIMPO|nr:proteolipid protein DM beta-like isoform X1 [Limulus polyphemus]
MGCKGSSKCISKVPFPSIIATVMCLSGSGIFLGSAYKGITLTIQMYEVVFQVKVQGFTDLRVVFVVLSLLSAILGTIMMVVGFLATGSTRNILYFGWKARMGGRVSCGLFLVTAYLVQIGWITILTCVIVILFVFQISRGLCNNLSAPDSKKECIDLSQFGMMDGLWNELLSDFVEAIILNFMFPNGIKYENLIICSDGKVKEFCNDYVEEGVGMYVMASVASVVIILSLVHYGICLAANYIKLNDMEKIRDLTHLNYNEEGN